METLDFDKKLSYNELKRYCRTHSEYHIPTLDEAEWLETTFNSFWIKGKVQDSRLVYFPQKNMLRAVPGFSVHHAILIKGNLD